MIQVDYFGGDITVTKQIAIHQLRLCDILAISQDAYFSSVNAWITIPSDAKSILYDKGIDYGKVDEFEYFSVIGGSTAEAVNELLISGFNPARAEKKQRADTGELILFDPKTGVKLDRFGYKLISDVLCQMHGHEKVYEKPCNRMAREFLIDEDRRKRKRAQEEKSPDRIGNMVSALVGKAGLQDRIESIKQNMTYYQLLDSLRRLGKIDRANNLNHGLYVGMIDGKKIDNKELDWARPL